MKILLLHSNSIKIIPRKQAIKSAEDAEVGKPIKMENCITVLAASEKQDEGRETEVAERFAEECRKYSEQVNVRKFMLYPYVHLTSNPSNPRTALKIIHMVSEKLAKEFKVETSPFGWYKEFKLHVKGHPLAELSRTF